ncbi:MULTISPECIES: hypothetical protein [unclassified Pseudomonas]|uniref:hypothetical protein n=1 Tax=unclassified Pseudomonas TaxID=196821 RepID=UPI00244D568E|nr:MULTISPECIES: hypothetical protein [unclassified Pseudomonas]MDH0304197.1 hypothetical protein [Pseudomonas sp. GD04091]MDH1986200.1 hypothetical protein [Pseudomonas sp. GD03689]
MDITISPHSNPTRSNDHVPPGRAGAGPLSQHLDQALSGEGFIQWIEVPTDASVDRHTLDTTCQRLRRYLQWMIGGPVLTILHVTPAQASDLVGISDAYLAVDTANQTGHAASLNLLDNQLRPAWPEVTVRPLALEAHGLSPARLAQRLADANPARAHTLALLLCDVPPLHDGSLWLFDPRDNPHNLRSVTQPDRRPHGLVHRWHGMVDAAARPPLPAPSDFERGLQLCSHLAQVFKEPTCA